jgi:hypothetical protein
MKSTKENQRREDICLYMFTRDSYIQNIYILKINKIDTPSDEAGKDLNLTFKKTKKENILITNKF